MNAGSGRSQTTKGIWIEKAPNMKPLTTVLDLEGTDGVERGEDDTAFERQSASFALVVADVLIINMWCNELGRERAANRPLLTAIFEAMMRLFSPRTTLLFVIRDKTTMTPFELLESKLRKDVQKIWETVRKPKGREDTLLSEFFNVEVTALSHYEYARDKFDIEVNQLRQRYFYSISPRQDASDISFRSANKIWDMIKQSKDLSFPPHRVMLATVRCEEIAKEQLRLFESNKTWLGLQEAVETGLVSGFNARISSILRVSMKKYDDETINFEEDVMKSKRQYLKSEALKVVHPAYMKTLGHLRSEALRSFETQLEALLSQGQGFAESVRTCRQTCELHFDRQCSDHAAIEHSNWDASIVREELLREIESHALLARTEKLPQIVDQQRERLNTKINTKLTNFLIETGDKDKWDSIRIFFESETDAAVSALSSALVRFELDQATVGKMLHDLKQYARRSLEAKFREEAKDAVKLMNHRLVTTLHENEGSGETNEASIDTKKEAAYRECLRLLSTVAVIRLDDKYHIVERVLLSSLMGSDSESSADLLASNRWQEVPPEMTLITPVRCRNIWSDFKLEIDRQLASARYMQEYCNEQCNKNNQKLIRIPFWITVGLRVLKDTGFMALLCVCNIDMMSVEPLVRAAIDILAAQIHKFGIMVKEAGRDVVAKIRKIGSDIKKRLELALIELYELMMAKFAERPPLMIGA